MIMTIDINLLRLESHDDYQSIYESQILRYPLKENDEQTALLSELQELGDQRRVLLRLLCALRNQYKTLQKALVPASTPCNHRILSCDSSTPVVDRDEAKEKIKQLKLKIRGAEQDLKTCEQQIEKNLPRIANIIDTLSSTLELSAISDGEDVYQKDSTNSKFDPSFCIGVYQNLPVGGKNLPVLTGIGADLARGLMSNALDYFNNRGLGLLAYLPEVSLSKEMQDSIFGSANDSNSCERTNSSIATALLHSNRTYWDRHLPIGECYVASSKMGKKSKLWYDNLQNQEKVGALGMTVCTLEESRKYQHGLAMHFVTFFTSLVHVRCAIRVRNVEPHKLLHHEASRLEILGQIGSSSVVLARVANWTDYVSRPLKIRCGGVHVEYVHLVQGEMCAIGLALEWCMHCNAIDGGVGIPHGLAKHMMLPKRSNVTDSGVYFVPFRRQIEKGSKVGKKSVIKELQDVDPPRWIHDEQSSKRKGSVRSKGEPFLNPSMKYAPTIGEQQDEGMTCPFDFLPIAKA